MTISKPSDFPDKYNPGDRVSYKSLNKLVSSIKGSSNRKFSEGLQCNSSSTQNSLSIDRNLFKQPIIAMITKATLVHIPMPTHKIPGEWKNNSNCYGLETTLPDGSYQFTNNGFVTVVAYSWVELTENFDETKKGEYFFQPEGSRVPTVEEVGSPICAKSPPENISTMNQGTVRSNPAYNVNNFINSNLGPGIIVEMYYGDGDYMLFDYSRNWPYPTLSFTDPFVGITHDFEQPYIPSEDFPG